MKQRIYLDYNATTPVRPETLEAMMPYFSERYGNASSREHAYGWTAEEAVDRARESVAKAVGARPAEIVFSSGATESVFLAIRGYHAANPHKSRHIISCRTEHRAVLDTLEALQREGFDLTLLEADRDGRIDLDALDDALENPVLMVCLMMANNETGVIHPVEQIAQRVHEAGAVLLTDVTQAVGKIPVDLPALAADLAVFSSHKIYGPKGAGALYINRKRGVRLNPVTFGGGQEKGLRPGTHNVPAIVGFGKACSLIDVESESKRLNSLRERLESKLLRIPGAVINGSGTERLPNTTSVSFRDVDGNRLIRGLRNLALSRGSACSSNMDRPSHVLRAMGLDDPLAFATLRISLGLHTSESDIDKAAADISERVRELKSAWA